MDGFKTSLRKAQILASPPEPMTSYYLVDNTNVFEFYINL